MKSYVLAAIFLAAALGGSLTAGAVPAGVSYAEGEAAVRFKSGTVRDAAIGDILNTGDGVRTGSDGLVELEQRGVTLRIDPDTVFTLMEKEQKGKATGVLSLVLGSIKFRYSRLTGQEPLIQTASCIAGVRGTELTVYAGVDGSALIVVEKGAVEVEAEGTSVALAPEEAVEVRPGQPPGDKFTVHRDQIDYRSWNDQKLKALLQEPLETIDSIGQQMQAYLQEIAEYYRLYSEHFQRLEQERRKIEEIAGKQGKEAAQKYSLEQVAPLRAQVSSLFLNLRYNTLAAFSLRRYVGGRIFLFLKVRGILQPEDATYSEFLTRYQRILNEFEQSVVPHLVEADI